MSDPLGIIYRIRIASPAGCRVVARFGWRPPGGGGSQWRDSGDGLGTQTYGQWRAHSRCLPASGPESCPCSTPWGPPRSSGQTAIGRRVLLPASACQVRRLRGDSQKRSFFDTRIVVAPVGRATRLGARTGRHDLYAGGPKNRRYKKRDGFGAIPLSAKYRGCGDQGSFEVGTFCPGSFLPWVANQLTQSP